MSTFYVYQLVDPRCGTVFYVGKGKGQRRFDHCRAVRSGRIDNPRKYRRIREILDNNLEPIARIVRGGLTERDAITLERCMLARLGPGGNLTNMIAGQKHALEHEVESLRQDLDQLRSALKYGKTFAQWRATTPTKAESNMKGLDDDLYHATVSMLRAAQVAVTNRLTTLTCQP